MNVVRWVGLCAIVGGLMSGQVARSFGQFGSAEAVAPLGDGLGAALATDRQEAARPQACQCLGEGDSSSVAEIKQALRAPLHAQGLEFNEVPLSEVIAVLQDEYKIPIQLDLPALENAGLNRDEQVTIQLHGISLKSALQIMLRNLNLASVIRDEVLVVTTVDVAESQLATCVYDVRDLIGANHQQDDIQELITAITSSVAPESWAKNGGGNAEIRSLRRGVLVISQTCAVQEKIADLLAAIRRIPPGSYEPTLADSAGPGQFQGLPHSFGRAGIGFSGEMGEGGFGGREGAVEGAGYGEGGMMMGRDVVAPEEAVPRQ